MFHVQCGDKLYYLLCGRLRITHAKPSDSGNYSCVPTVAERASVNVHVINGKSVRNAITDPRDKIIPAHASITYPRAAAIHPVFVYHSALTLSRMVYPFSDDLIFSHARVEEIKMLKRYFLAAGSLEINLNSRSLK